MCVLVIDCSASVRLKWLVSSRWASLLTAVVCWLLSGTVCLNAEMFCIWVCTFCHSMPLWTWNFMIYCHKTRYRDVCPIMRLCFSSIIRSISFSSIVPCDWTFCGYVTWNMFITLFLCSLVSHTYAVTILTQVRCQVQQAILNGFVVLIIMTHQVNQHKNGTESHFMTLLM
jgi:hypothetical protein